MSLSRRQLIVIAGIGACALIAAAICIFAPARIALVAVLAFTGLSTLVVLMFLRRVLAATYQVRDELRVSEERANRSREEAVLERRLVSDRLERIELHLPERLAARIAFELHRSNKPGEIRDPDGHTDGAEPTGVER